MCGANYDLRVAPLGLTRWETPASPSTTSPKVPTPLGVTPHTPALTSPFPTTCSTTAVLQGFVLGVTFWLWRMLH